jgi:hypothetical protein
MARDESKPTIIKDFPGQAVDAYLQAKGCLPGEVCYTDMDSNILLAAAADMKEWGDASATMLRRLYPHWWQWCERRIMQERVFVFRWVEDMLKSRASDIFDDATGEVAEPSP